MRRARPIRKKKRRWSAWTEVIKLFDNESIWWLKQRKYKSVPDEVEVKQARGEWEDTSGF